MFKKTLLISSCIILTACQTNSLNDKYVNKLKDSLKSKSQVSNEIEQEYLLANDYFYGLDKEENPNKACAIYERLAFKKDPQSIQGLANCYYFGKGRQEDNIKACSLFEQAAQYQLADAQRDLGNCYALNLHNQESLELASFWYKKAANQNDSLALDYLKEIQSDQSYTKSNPNLAFSVLQKLSIAGDMDAQLALANLYKNTKNRKDLKKAFYWLKKSADQGNDEAEYMMGKAYFNGLLVEQDFEHAFYWFERAAIDAYPSAYSYLANAYQLGQGVEQDLEQYHYWLSKSQNTKM